MSGGDEVPGGPGATPSGGGSTAGARTSATPQPGRRLPVETPGHPTLEKGAGAMPFVHRWRILVAAFLLAAAMVSPALAQGPRNQVMYVLLGDHYFLPASITVQSRTTVVWIN